MRNYQEIMERMLKDLVIALKVFHRMNHDGFSTNRDEAITRGRIASEFNTVQDLGVYLSGGLTYCSFDIVWEILYEDSKYGEEFLHDDGTFNTGYMFDVSREAKVIVVDFRDTNRDEEFFYSSDYTDRCNQIDRLKKEFSL